MQTLDKLQFDRLREQASFLLKTGRYSLAIDYAKKALSISPDDPRPMVQIAYALASIKDPASSEWARKAIAVDPQNALWRGALSDTYNIRGRWSEGLQSMREAVGMAPRNPRLLSGLGLCLINTRKYAEAVPYLQKALEMYPNDPDTHRRLSIALLKIGDVDASEYHFKQALQLQPDTATAQANLGWNLRRKGRYAKADEAFKEALRLDPQFTAARVGLGAPFDNRSGLTSRFLYFTVRIAAVKHRRLIHIIQMYMLIVLYTITFQVVPSTIRSMVEIIDVIYIGWLAYFLLARRIANYLGKGRGIHFI